MPIQPVYYVNILTELIVKIEQLNLKDELIMLSASKKVKIIETFRQNVKDTGSPEVQVALLTNSINELTEHLRTHNKDFNARRGLLMMVGKRRRFLQYLNSQSHERYRKLIDSLNIRR